MRIGVIGLGLIGGSLARDLATAGHEVLGADRSGATLRSAKRSGILAGALGRRFSGIERCDVCVIAVPVDAAIRVLESAGPRLADVPLVTDVGSTKQSIVRAAERLGLGCRFVGSHPLAGDHVSGWRASRTGLFAGACVYLTRARTSTPTAMRRARTLWTSVGARPVLLGAAAHDALLSATSQLPQVAALALATVLAGAGIPRSALGRGGRDMTRLAASSPEVWAAILVDNATPVAIRVARLREALGHIEEQIRTRDAAAMRHLLVRTGTWARR